MSSQSDHYRRLFSGTLGLLPAVFSNKALGETFQFLYICPVSALRSTIGILTIRPIKEIFQWHFGVAACYLS